MKIDRSVYIDSLLLNREVLEEYGMYINLGRGKNTTDDKYLMECFSRWALGKFREAVYPDVVNVTQESFFNHWDVTLGRGPKELALEGKVRTYTSDEYADYKISYKKTTWEEIREKRLLVVMTFLDGKQYVFNVDDGYLDENSEWGHTQTTGSEFGNEKKWMTEPAVVFDREKALFDVDITLPPIDGKTKWTREQFNWQGRTS